ncbi:hypothetical protein BGX34_003207 [Mortierella sp. NVP85]|nr:hypothetical protein BGX34_003207 [Mortierella sp. NVP85]
MFLSSNWFYSYQFSTVNGFYFSFRTQSLNNILYWALQIAGSYSFTRVLDYQGAARRTRALWGLVFITLAFVATWIGGIFFQRTYTIRDLKPLHDFKEGSSYLGPLFLLFYGLNDAAGRPPFTDGGTAFMTELIVCFALLGASLPGASFLAMRIHDRTEDPGEYEIPAVDSKSPTDERSQPKTSMIAQHDKNTKTPGNGGQHTAGQLEQEAGLSLSYPVTLSNMTVQAKSTDTDGYKDGDEVSLQEEQEEQREECDTDSSHCVICLNTCEDRTVLATCHHEFCFHCILQWSMVSRSCPLCVQIFDSCIHNIKGDQIYTVHRFEELSSTSSAPASSSSSPSTHTTTLNRPSMTVPYGIIRQLYGPPQNRGRRYRNQQRSESTEERSVAEQQQRALEKRRHVYRNRLFVRHMGANKISGFQQVTPETFKVFPHKLNRLIPWIRRELRAIFTLSSSSATILATADYHEQHPSRHRYEEIDTGLELTREYIIAVLKRYDLQTDQAQDLLRDFLHEHTELFVHELMAFARSPYSIEAYDQAAQYPGTHKDSRMASAGQGDVSTHGRGRRTTIGRSNRGDDDVSFTETRQPSNSESSATNSTNTTPRLYQYTKRSRSRDGDRGRSKRWAFEYERRFEGRSRYRSRSRSNDRAGVLSRADSGLESSNTGDSQDKLFVSRNDVLTTASYPALADTTINGHDSNNRQPPISASRQDNLASILRDKLKREREIYDARYEHGKMEKR